MNRAPVCIANGKLVITIVCAEILLLSQRRNDEFHLTRKPLSSVLIKSEITKIFKWLRFEIMEANDGRILFFFVIISKRRQMTINRKNEIHRRIRFSYLANRRRNSATASLGRSRQTKTESRSSPFSCIPEKRNPDMASLLIRTTCLSSF